MKKTVLILTAVLLATIKSFGQEDVSGPKSNTNGKSNVAEFGIKIPVGKFSQTHIAGIGLAYSWSHHRFGSLKTLPKNLIGFTANGGIDYYFGKSETVAGYNYRYDEYIYLQAFAGAVYNPCKNGNIMLTAGPGFGIYKGNADVGLGIKLNGNYYLTQRVAISPGVMYMKNKLANTLWSLMLMATYTL